MSGERDYGTEAARRTHVHELEAQIRGLKMKLLTLELKLKGIMKILTGEDRHYEL